MNELPNELICTIFHHLDLIDLYDICRLVSKKWLELVDQMKFKELILTDLEKTYLNHWYYTLEVTNPNNLIYINRPAKFYGDLKISIKDNFSNLKRLKIDFSHFIYLFNIEKLNDFAYLEHLELIGINIKYGLYLRGNICLCLPKLRVLNLLLSLHPFHLLTIDAAKLEVLNCHNLSGFKLIHPKSIKFLECESMYELIDLNMFSNLEVFKIFILADDFNRSLLSKLPNCLNELHLNRFHYIIDNSERWMNYLKFLSRDKLNQRRSKLKIYMNGVEMSNKPLNLNEVEPLKFIYKNYEQLKISSYNDLNYHHLIEVFERFIPHDFFEKFNKIQMLIVDKKVDQDEFIWFLKGCRILKKLELRIYSGEKSLFNQQFYNQLPEIATSLFDLNVDEGTDQIDFKFISEFKMLTYFETNQHIPRPLVMQLIKNTKLLKKIQYSSFSDAIVFTKNLRTNQFSVQFRGQFDYKLELNEFHYDQNSAKSEWILI